MKKFLLGILIMLFNGSIIIAQNTTKEIDSLYNVLETLAESEKAPVLYQLGKQLSHISEYGLALNYQFQSLEIAQGIGDTNMQRKNLLGISATYGRMGNLEKTLEYSQKALDISLKQKNNEASAAAYNNTGMVYLEQKQYTKALKLFHTADSLVANTNNRRFKAAILNNIGLIHTRTGEHGLALQYFRKSYRLASETNDSALIVSKLLNIGEVHTKLGNLQEAENILTLALLQAENNNFLSLSRNIHYVLYELYTIKKNMVQALLHLKKYSELADSLARKLQDENILNIEIRSAVREKENRIQQLKNENLLKQKDIQVQKTRQYLFAATALLSFTLLVMMLFKYINYKKRKQQETEHLLNELKLLRAEIAVNNIVNTSQNQELALDKQTINMFTENKLNPTDWKILEILVENPVITNSQLAERVFLSTEGVKSSLKKMYRLFDIQRSGENQKIALSIAVLRLSRK